MGHLHNLGLKYNTDKAIPHNYCDTYETNLSHLKNEPIKFMEIGVFNGSSLKMWEEFFPSSKIIGIDIHDKKEYDTDRIKTIVGDQSDRNFLNKFNNSEFDVILDDGGHTMAQQMISFGCLFQKLKNGGIYILEDLITSLWASYGGNPENVNTTLSLLHELKTTGKINSAYLLPEEKRYIEDNVREIKIFGHYGDVSVSTQAITSIIIKK